MITPQNPSPPRWCRIAAIIAALTVAVAILVSSTAANPPLALAGPDGCPVVQVLMVPGTTETNPAADPAEPRGLLRGVGEPLARKFGPLIDIYWLLSAAARCAPAPEGTP